MNYNFIDRPLHIHVNIREVKSATIWILNDCREARETISLDECTDTASATLQLNHLNTAVICHQEILGWN